jgi:hypothetical protein
MAILPPTILGYSATGLLPVSYVEHRTAASQFHHYREYCDHKRVTTKGFEVM